MSSYYFFRFAGLETISFQTVPFDETQPERVGLRQIRATSRGFWRMWSIFFRVNFAAALLHGSSRAEARHRPVTSLSMQPGRRSVPHPQPLLHTREVDGHHLHCWGFLRSAAWLRSTVNLAELVATFPHIRRTSNVVRTTAASKCG